MTGQIAIGHEDIKEIRLYGVLAKKFGKIHRFAVKTAREAANALAATIPGFKQHLIDNNQPGYHVFVGSRKVANNIGVDMLDAPVGRSESIQFVPAIVGSKKTGALQTIIGVVLIVVGAVTGQAWLVKMGVMLAVSGVIQMLTPVTRQTKRDELDQVSSYHFDGPTNQTREGAPVQIVFGRTMIGSSVVAQGIFQSDLA